MKIKLLFAGLLTPALTFTSNAIIYPGAKIVDGVFDLYRNKPFQIPAFESFAVRPEVLNKYVGIYSMPQTR